MRRLRTSILTLLSIALLGLCIAAAVISRHRTLRWGFSTLHGHYTFLIDHARLMVRVPPPPQAEDARAWELVKRLRNEDIRWVASWIEGRNEPIVSPMFEQDSPAYRLRNFLHAGSDEPYLRALDSPKKFIAAHLLLDSRDRDDLSSWIHTDPNRKSFRPWWGGMVKFHLRLKRPEPNDERTTYRIPPSAMTIDPSQLSTIRDMWHDVLDRTLVSISIWWMTCPAIIVISLLLAGALRRRKRLRSGRCVQCGYDLRASSGVCPECGTASQHVSALKTI